MKHHTKVYMNYFGYQIAQDCICEIPGCGAFVTDVCHIDARGMGGDPQHKKDVIENLMGKCRYHHLLYGDVPDKMDWLYEVHFEFMKNNKK